VQITGTLLIDIDNQQLLNGDNKRLIPKDDISALKNRRYCSFFENRYLNR
jgi:hypothetical protein